MRDAQNYKIAKTNNVSTIITAVVAAVLAVFATLLLANALGFMPRGFGNPADNQVLADTHQANAENGDDMGACPAPSGGHGAVQGATTGHSAGFGFKKFGSTTTNISSSSSSTSSSGGSSITNTKLVSFSSVKEDNDLVDIDDLVNVSDVNVLSKNSILNNSLNNNEILNENNILNKNDVDVLSNNLSDNEELVDLDILSL